MIPSSPVRPPRDYFDAWTCVGQSMGMHPRLPHTVSDLVLEMRQCHVGCGLVDSTWSAVRDVMSVNRSLSEGLPAFLSPLWTVLPGAAGDFPEKDNLLALLESHRVGAVQILPKTHAWNIGAADALFRALGDGGWPVFVPLESEVPLACLETLARKFQKIRWVALHAHWTRQREIAALMREHLNVWMTLENYHANRGIEHLIHQGCGGRLLFASGAPKAAMGAARAVVDWLDADDDRKAAIAGGNLRQLLRHHPGERLTAFDEPDPIASEAFSGRPISCEVIDFHSHILGDGENSGGAQVMLRGDAEGLLDMADRIGIDRIGVMTWLGIQSPLQEEGHRPVLAASQHPSDRFWGLATIQPGDKSNATKIGELESLLKQSIKILGLKPYPTLGLPYDHAKFGALWDYAEKHGLYVGIHPFHWYEPREFEAICGGHPTLRVVAYHAGCNYDVADTVITLCRRFPNLYAEINYSSVTGGVIEYLVEGCGADRVLFGTDQPMRDPRQQLGWVVHARLPVETKVRILGGNAIRFLASLGATG